MELDNHELEGWEGPTPGEVAKEVAVEVRCTVLSTNYALYMGNISAIGNISVSTVRACPKLMIEVAREVAVKISPINYAGGHPSTIFFLVISCIPES